MQTMLFIGGEWRPASDGGTFPVVDPATEKSITEVSNATAEDVTSAVHVAYTAGKDWAKKLKEFESKRKDEPIKAGRFVGLM